MTIEWRYTIQPDLGVLSLAGFLGTDAVGRFAGAVGWAVARGTGPVILDLTSLRGWSDGGRAAVAEAAARLAAQGRSLELAAAPDGGCPPIPGHPDLPAALAAHRGGGEEQRAWSTGDWPAAERPV
ncbi:anti-sigma factor antagonist [Streptomyces tritici]|uniref:anti-sigma factor antagonist n=1 Tax=Streptomyces tritici TaxID=2054410 RepID=UPI003AF00B66